MCFTVWCSRASALGVSDGWNGPTSGPLSGFLLSWISGSRRTVDSGQRTGRGSGALGNRWAGCHWPGSDSTMPAFSFDADTIFCVSALHFTAQQLNIHSPLIVSAQLPQDPIMLQPFNAITAFNNRHLCTTTGECVCVSVCDNVKVKKTVFTWRWQCKNHPAVRKIFILTNVVKPKPSKNSIHSIGVYSHFIAMEPLYIFIGLVNQRRPPITEKKV